MFASPIPIVPIAATPAAPAVAGAPVAAGAPGVAGAPGEATEGFEALLATALGVDAEGEIATGGQTAPDETTQTAEAAALLAPALPLIAGVQPQAPKSGAETTFSSAPHARTRPAPTTALATPVDPLVKAAEPVDAALDAAAPALADEELGQSARQAPTPHAARPASPAAAVASAPTDAAPSFEIDVPPAPLAQASEAPPAPEATEAVPVAAGARRPVGGLPEAAPSGRAPEGRSAAPHAASAPVAAPAEPSQARTFAPKLKDAPLASTDAAAAPSAAQSAQLADSTLEAPADAGKTTELPTAPPSASTETPAQRPAAIQTRGAPETVAALAADILKKLDGRSTRFEVELQPAGLGRVDVRIEIGVAGKLTAAFAFDSPQAAAELRGRSADLQRTLEQAGFDVSGGLSFDLSDNSRYGREPEARQDSGWRGRAFAAALAAGEAADQAAAPPTLTRRLNAGLDIWI